MAIYLLNCTVCEKNFVTSETWTRHLFQEEHQEKARLECWKWEEPTKKCALVIHFNSPIKMEDASNLAVLLWNHLKITVGGKRKGVCVGGSPSLLIADLVWWRERPNIVILQFESREKADQAFSQMVTGGQGATPEPAGVKIGNYLVQCRKLADLLEFEWRNLNQVSRILSHPSTSVGSPPVKRRKMTASSSSSSSSRVPAPTTSSPRLVTEFKRLLKSVEVSSSVILQSKQIIEKLKRLMKSKYPSCQFTVFRNIYLKIRHPFCNDLLIFAHGGITSESPQSYLELDIHEIAKYVMVLDFSLDYKNQADPKYKASQFFKQDPLDFWVITDPAYIVEVQLNQLFEYLLTFDPRCGPLLSCVHCFCTVNSCYFGESPAKGEAIEWLLIFFLSKEKIIPTVRQILEQPHQPIMLPNSDKNVDIGFNPDPAFANKWRRRNRANIVNSCTEKFVSGVLKVFQNFLHFLAKMLPDGNFILNTKDAELQNRWQLLSQPKVNWNTKLSEEEMKIIKSHPALIDGEFSKWPFTIVHPLVVHLNLGYNANEFHGAAKKMKRGVFQLKMFVCQRKRKGSWRYLQSVLKVKDVSKEEDRKKAEEEARKLAKNEALRKAKEEAQKAAWEKARKEDWKNVEEEVRKIRKEAQMEADGSKAQIKAWITAQNENRKKVWENIRGCGSRGKE